MLLDIGFWFDLIVIVPWFFPFAVRMYVTYLGFYRCLQFRD